MNFSPFKLIRTAELAELRMAAAAGELDAQEAVALEEERDELLAERDDLLVECRGLRDRQAELRSHVHALELALVTVEQERLRLRDGTRRTPGLVALPPC
ncbi:hypothetical protein [Streptomyces melanogenes]|uniref:hypothetical protein n=1 Tax=Streptomyces melanogenes TaxID=67326 RepID=UPI00167E8CCB|nr:hypothetical protein [Streptomyces melanogenes]GGP85832.1 hypothetical protein GCM10010278_75340 [Streptomyces melanogenes]